MSGRTLTVGFFACGLFAFAQLRPIHDVDLFWQVATGERMLSTGHLVTTDPFSSTHAGEPVPPVYWLSQLSYALVVKYVGWEALHTLDSLLFAASFGVIAWRLATPSNPTALFSAFVLAGWVAFPSISVRPQTFAVAGFALMMLVESSARPIWLRALLTLAIVTAWQNLHPSGATALAYLGARCVERAASRGSVRAAYPTLPLIAAALVGCCLTPMGVGIWEFTRVNAEVARSLEVGEWLPAWHPDTRDAAIAYWAALGVSVGILTRVARIADRGDIVRLILWGIAATLVCRLTLFFAMAMLPVWARWVALTSPGFAERGREHIRGGKLIAVIVFTLAALLPNLADKPTFSPELPLAGVEALKRESITGPVYNFREWGGPLIHASQRVTIDGRLYFYPLTDWRRYNAEAADDIPLAGIIERYNPAAFFLRPGVHARLTAELQTSADWKKIYADDVSVVFVRRNRPEVH